MSSVSRNTPQPITKEPYNWGRGLSNLAISPLTHGAVYGTALSEASNPKFPTILSKLETGDQYIRLEQKIHGTLRTFFSHPTPFNPNLENFLQSPYAKSMAGLTKNIKQEIEDFYYPKIFDSLLKENVQAIDNRTAKQIIAALDPVCRQALQDLSQLKEVTVRQVTKSLRSFSIVPSMVATFIFSAALNGFIPSKANPDPFSDWFTNVVGDTLNSFVTHTVSTEIELLLLPALELSMGPTLIVSMIIAGGIGLAIDYGKQSFLASAAAH